MDKFSTHSSEKAAMAFQVSKNRHNSRTNTYTHTHKRITAVADPEGVLWVQLNPPLRKK